MSLGKADGTLVLWSRASTHLRTFLLQEDQTDMFLEAED